MSVYIRRFTFDPGNTVLLEIESVDILDLTPPSAIQGIGSGTALIVGEFEDGPFASQVPATEVFSPNDFSATFGSLGYQYGALVGQNPCARSRHADSAIAAEFWNGNGFVQLNAKKFARLLITRVDTSVGQVTFTRLPFLTGAAGFAFALSTGQVLQLDTGSGPQSATFTGVAATITGVGGTYPTTFAGGETLTLAYDLVPAFTVTFQSGDQSAAQVAARINTYAGFTFADTNGGQLRLTGRQAGTGGSVTVVSGSGSVLTTLGLTVGTTIGTGNVANIAAVSPGEVTTIVQAAVTNSRVEVDQNGALRISNTGSSDFIVVGAGTTATALGFLSGAAATDLGEPILVSGAGTYNLTHTGTITIQLDASLPAVTTTVNSGDSLSTTVGELNAAFTAAGQGAPVTADGSSRFYVKGTKPGGTLSVVSASAGNILTELGLAVGQTVGVIPPQGSLPAGTVVQGTGVGPYVTMQTLTFGANGVTLAGLPQPAAATSWNVPVRHALDDGTGTMASANTVTSIPTAPAIGSFSVNNSNALSAALTESAIDAQYGIAMGKTNDTSSVASQANIMWSARQSNSCRRNGRSTALNASANGCFGRMFIGRTPLGTTETTALSNTAEPGVGAYRSDRYVHCYPQARTSVPIIALVGTSGGAGFSPDGSVDVGADGFLVSIMSQLPPEENPGQQTTFADGVISLESSPNVQGFQMTDYIAFKAAGICALRMDNGNAIFQSGVTSVNPLTDPTLVPIKRRRMSDFLQDSIAVSMKPFGKQLQKLKRRQAIKQEIVQFLNGLAGGGPGAAVGNPNNEDTQRIGGYNVDDKKGNLDQNAVDAGIWRLIIKVKLLSDFQAIVLQTEIGETVTVSELTS